MLKYVLGGNWLEYFDLERDVMYASGIWLPHEKSDSLKCQLIRAGLPVFNADRDGCTEIEFAQIRYKKLDKVTHKIEIKTDWLSNEEMPKRILKLIKKDSFVNRCHWSFWPLAIEHEKQTTIPSEQKFIYALLIRQYPIPADWEKKYPYATRYGAVEYYARIETRLDGSIIRRQYYQNLPHEDLHHKFAFPKRFVSKMNKCLWNNYWQRFLQTVSGREMAKDNVSRDSSPIQQKGALS